MPALVPIVQPSQVVGAVCGRFFGEKLQVCVANSHQLVFYDANFHPCSLAVPTANAISSIGRLRSKDSDSLVLCVPDRSRKKSLVCIASCTQSQISTKIVFEYNLLGSELKFLCTNSAATKAIVRLMPGQLLVLESDGSSYKANVFGGTWGRVIDACFTDEDELVLLENAPAMAPCLSVNTLGPHGITQQHLIVVQDLEGCVPHLYKWGSQVLVAGRDSVSCLVDTSLEVLCKIGAAYFSSVSSTLIIGSTSGTVFSLAKNNTLKRLFGSNATNMVCLDDTALAWSPAATQVLRMPSGEQLQQWPTLGPLSQIRPFHSTKSSGLLLSTGDCTFKYEYSASASLVAEVSIDGICTLIMRDVLLVSTLDETLAFSIHSDRISQLEAYLFYDLDQETLAANGVFQVTPRELKTKDNSVEIRAELATVSGRKVAVACKNTIKLFDASLALCQELAFEGPRILRFVWDKLCLVGDHGIQVGSEQLERSGVSDITQFGGYLVVGTRQGQLEFYDRDLQLVKELLLLQHPVTFSVGESSGESLLVLSNKVLLFDATLEYVQLVLGQPTSMLAPLGDSMVCGVHKNKLKIFFTQNSFRPNVQPITSAGLAAIADAGSGFKVATSTPTETLLHNYNYEGELSGSVTLSVPYDEAEMQLFGFSGGSMLISGGLDRTCTVTVVCSESQSSFDTNLLAPMFAVETGDGEFAIVQENRRGTLRVSSNGIQLEYTDSLQALPRSIDVQGGRSLFTVHYSDALLESARDRDCDCERVRVPATADAQCGLLLGDDDFLIYTTNTLVAQQQAFKFDEQVSCMARVQGALVLGTSSGGVYLYLKFEDELEECLSALWREYEKAPKALFHQPTELVRWAEFELQELPSLSEAAGIDCKLLGKIQQQIKACTL